jgi:hypothetical protein
MTIQLHKKLIKTSRGVEHDFNRNHSIGTPFPRLLSLHRFYPIITPR